MVSIAVHYVLPVVFSLHISHVLCQKIEVDMGGPGCRRGDDLTVSDSEIVTLYVERLLNQKEVYDHCDVGLRTAKADRHFQYFVEILWIQDCGTKILIYDNPSAPTTATRVISCEDSGHVPISGRSSQSWINISIQKQSAQHTQLEFQMRVKTNYGPDIEFERKDSEFREATLDTGAIVGIAVAGTIFIIALIGLAIYCCLRNRMESMKYTEASEAQSAPSVFISGTSQTMFSKGSSTQCKGGRNGSYGSTEDVRSSTSSHDNANYIYSNKAYKADEGEKKLNRQGSFKQTQKCHLNAAFDETDVSYVREEYPQRRSSGRRLHGGKSGKVTLSIKEMSEFGRVSKVPNGILKTRSRSPNRSHSSTESGTVDNKALVYGYSETRQAHPNTLHVPVVESRRSRSKTRANPRLAGSFNRSRSSSVGKVNGVGNAPSKSRQFADMTGFLNQPHRDHRRQRSASLGRRSRRDSKTSDNPSSEVSFATSGVSSKRSGNKRVHIQTVESDI